MSSRQAINTQGVESAVNNIRRGNNSINNDFRALQRRMERLGNNWQSAAGTVAQTTMQQIVVGNESRSGVLDNFCTMLMQQVNPGYIQAEQVNTRLADKFK